MKRLLLILTLIVFLSGFAAAQGVRVSATVDSNRFMIGEWIALQLTVDAPAKSALRLPDSDDDVENGDYVSSEEAEVETRGDRRLYRQQVFATVFDTGSIALRIRVRYTEPGDTTVFEAFSNTISFEITTVELDTSQTFKDIRDVLDVPLGFWDYLLYAAILLFIAAAAWFGYRWYKKRQERPIEIAPEVAAEIPAHVLALQALESLRERRVWQNGEHKVYQSELTDVLRLYIDRRFRIPAMEHPTSEIIPSLAVLGIGADRIERMERVLRVADMTKFARFTPSSMEHEEGMTFAVEFVEATKPTTETQSGGPAQGATAQGGTAHV
jgi:hypothetical protein